MAVLKMMSTMDVPAERATILLYGDNGSGKTTFAATWPNPVFLVPAIAVNELRALKDFDLPVIPFAGTKDLEEQVTALGKEILGGRLRCSTLVVDNLTAFQLMVEEELKVTANKDKLDFSEWGVFTTLFKRLMTQLRLLPCHVLWITHQTVRVNDDRRVGELTLMGKSKTFIPNYADMIMQMECVDLRAAGTKYRLRIKPHDIWTNIRIRTDRATSEAFPPYIENPSYDDLAALLGWASCEAIESGAVEAPQEPTAKPSQQLKKQKEVTKAKR